MTLFHGSVIFPYFLTLGWYRNMLLIDNEYDQIFDLKVVIGHCDLISWSSDFVIYLDTLLVQEHASFRK